MSSIKLLAQCPTLCSGSRNVPQLLFPVACSPTWGHLRCFPRILPQGRSPGEIIAGPSPKQHHCAKHLPPSAPKAWRSNGSLCIQIVGTMLCSRDAVACFPRMRCETCVSALQHPPMMITIPPHRFSGLLTCTLSRCLNIPPGCFLLIRGIRGLCCLGGRCYRNATILWVEGSMI